MAEIKVERKRRSLLPLLLALLLLAALVWWWLSRSSAVVASNADTTSMTTDVAAGTGAAVSTTTDTASSGMLPSSTAAAAAGGAGASALDDFASFVGNSTIERNENQQHEYTAGGLRRLATVLESMNPGGASQAQLDLMRQKADSLQTTAATNDRHADMARAAFNAASEVMRALPGANGASKQIQAVTRAAGALDPARKMLDQKDGVQTFFNASRDALRAMSGAGPT